MEYLRQIGSYIGLSETTASALKRMIEDKQEFGLRGRLTSNPKELQVFLRTFAEVSKESSDDAIPRMMTRVIEDIEKVQSVDRTGRGSILPPTDQLLLQIIQAGDPYCLYSYMGERPAQSNPAAKQLMSRNLSELLQALDAGGPEMWERFLGRLGKDTRKELRQILLGKEDLAHLSIVLDKTGWEIGLKEAVENKVSENFLKKLLDRCPDMQKTSLWENFLLVVEKHEPKYVKWLLERCPTDELLHLALQRWWRARGNEEWKGDPISKNVYAAIAAKTGWLLNKSPKNQTNPLPWVLHYLIIHKDQASLDIFRKACGDGAWRRLWETAGAWFMAPGPLFQIIKEERDILGFAMQACPKELLASHFELKVQGLGLIDLAFRIGKEGLGFYLLDAAPKDVVDKFWDRDEEGKGPLHRSPPPSPAAIAEIWRLCPQEHRQTLTASDHHGRSPLFYWCAEAPVNTEAALATLPEDIRAAMWDKDHKGHSPIHYALDQGIRSYGIEQLPWDAIPEERMAEVWGPDGQGRTLAHIAASQGFWSETLISRCPKNYRSLQWAPDVHGMNPFLLALGLVPKMSGGFGGGLGEAESAYNILPYVPKELQERVLSGVDDRGFGALHLLVTKPFEASILTEWREKLGGKKALEARSLDGLRPLDLFVSVGHDPLLIPELHPDFDHADQTLREFIEEYRLLRASQNYSDYIKLELANALYLRIAERHPEWAKGEISLPFVQPLFKFLMANSNRPELGQLLNTTLRMNQALPFDTSTLQRILDLFGLHPKEDVQIGLALQTGALLEDIEIAFSPEEQLQASPEEKQLRELTLAQVLRKRDALELANRIIKDDGVSDALLLQALRYLERVQIAPTAGTLRRIYELSGESGKRSPELRAQAVRAAAAVNQDPYDATHKQVLLNLLQENSLAALEALSECHYRMDEPIDREVVKTVMQLLEGKNLSPNWRCTCAVLLSVIPEESALIKSAEIIGSSDWDRFDTGTGGLEGMTSVGHFMLYPYKPRFERNRARMQRMLAERYLELKRSERQPEINRQLQAFHQNPSSSVELRAVRQAITDIAENTRFLGFPLFYPKKRVFFRGVGSRQAEVLRHAVFDEIRMAGSGSSDLSLHPDMESGTWAKIGQIFVGSTLSFVMAGYFDTDGILMVIPTDEVNEAQMRCQLRYEKERSEINGVFYQRIQQYKIQQLFMSNSYKRDLESERQLVAIRKAQGSTDWKVLAKPSRIALRRFHQIEAGQPTSLADRVSFFEPEGSLELQVRSRMQELNLQETSMQELINENLERHIGRRILASSIPINHPLKQCLDASCRMPLPLNIAPSLQRL